MFILLPMVSCVSFSGGLFAGGILLFCLAQIQFYIFHIITLSLDSGVTTFSVIA